MEYRIIGKLFGKEIKAYTLTDGIIKVEVMTLGATTTSLLVPDKNGEVKDVVLGYGSLEEYLKNTCYVGATIGRVCNVIKNAEFELNGKKYKISVNDGVNSLHGGKEGFDKKIWEDKVVGDTLELSCASEDGEEGYPGKLAVKVAFTVKNGGLYISYTATSDKDTIINLTNHSYFNLDGEDSGDILSTLVTINSDKVTSLSSEILGQGEYIETKGTPLDFNTEKMVREGINSDFELIKSCGGYDFNYVLNGEGFREVATAFSINSGIKLRVLTDQKGMQFYTGNQIDPHTSKSANIYEKFSGFCMETQGYPNAINYKNYPSIILRKGETYCTSSAYLFEIVK